MKIYEFKCMNEKCPKKGEIIQEIQNMHDNHIAKCVNCDKLMRRIYSLGGFSIDFKPGFDPGLGEYVETKRQRENIISENNLRRIID